MDYMDEGLNTCFVEDPYSLKLLPVVSTLSPSAAFAIMPQYSSLARLKTLNPKP